LVLKRFADAVADGDRILALIRGTAANQDGRSNGLTAPNGLAQTRVVTDALADADVPPGVVGYVEAHGTGTALGDPIELHALDAALSPGRAPGEPVIVGSVKTNIGHTEGAAGVAGLIKTILMLQAKQIAPSLHFATPNPFIEWSRIPISVATRLEPWSPIAGRRVAGVSSFGFSGSNVHIVLEEAPVPAPRAERSVRDTQLIPISAHSEPALRAIADRVARAMETDPTLALDDVALTAGAGRAHFEVRAAIIAQSTNELRDQLHALVDGRDDVTVLRGTGAGEEPRIAFLYTGQGSQFAGMGAPLYDAEPVFRAALDRCAAALGPILPVGLLDVMLSTDALDRRIHLAPFTLPAMLSLQFALTELWRSWGIAPAAVMGHSAGEYAAAVAAGVLSIEDALPLIAERARLMQVAGGGGSMLAVFAPAEAVAGELAAHPTVSIAAFNGPDNVVVSGPREEVGRVSDRLIARGVEVRPLEISYASHSPLMEPVLDEFERAVSRATLSAPELVLVSNVSGTVAGPEVATPAYWRRHLREPVRFADGVARLRGLGARLFVEIGPHPSLVSMARRYTAGDGLHWLASMRRDRGPSEQMLETLGTMYVQGAAVDWRGVAGARARRVSLPSYPFQRETFWIDEPHAARTEPATGLPGRRTDLARGPVVFDGTLSCSELPWLAAHRVGGTPIAPASLLVDLAREAAELAFEIQNAEIANLRIDAPLVVPDAETVRVQTIVERDTDGSAAVEILTRGADGRWTAHAQCVVRPTTALEAITGGPHPTAAVDLDSHYALVGSFGIALGPEFRRLRSLAAGGGESSGTVEVFDGASANGSLDPVTVDACIQVLGACLRDEPDAFLMVGADVVAMPSRPSGSALHVVARLRSVVAAEERVADLTARDANGAVVLSMHGVRLRRATSLRRAASDPVDDLLYHVRWMSAPTTSAGTASEEHWLIVGGPPELARELSVAAERAGARATVIELSASTDGGDLLESHLTAQMDASAARGTPSRVIYLGGVATDGASEHVERSAEAVCRLALALARELVRREWASKLWLVASGATPVTATSATNTVAGGALFGFGRSFAGEHRELWGGAVDVDARPADLANTIVEELTSTANEPEVSRGRGGRFVPRLTPLEPASGAPPTALRADVAYVVTGGLGGIGRALLGWLVDRGARKLALLVRRTPTAAESATLDAIRARGARIRLIQADVSNETAVGAALGEVRREMAPIAGVFHAAGVYNDAIFERMDWPRFESVLSPKLFGAWHLHRHTLDDAVEHFVLFSSAAALFGPVALSNYAAANAGLDALARLRRAEGRAALSIEWGPWAGAGMADAVGATRQRQWESSGLSRIPESDALAALGRLMARDDVAEATALSVDWRAFADGGSGVRPLFASLGRGSGTRVEGAPRAGVPRDESAELGAIELAGLDAAQRRERLTAFLRQAVARELGIGPERLPMTKPLTALGLDSLMAVQLRNRVQDALHVTVPVSRFVQGPSIEQLVDEVLSRLEGASAPRQNGASPASDPVAAPPVDVGALSDGDVERMLRELLSGASGNS
jgi:acyl transferase domain-containing protein/NADP-dependent 3-hydroxy acid dehydrogenase YdfG/acyl carrier protein